MGLKMSFDEIIEQQRQKQRQVAEADTGFISIYELYIALQKRFPDQSLNVLSLQLLKCLNEHKPPLYKRESLQDSWREFGFIPKYDYSSGRPELTPALLRVTNGRYDSPEEMITSVQKYPLGEADLEQFALRRADIIRVLGIDIEKSPAPAVSDYVRKLEEEIESLKVERDKLLAAAREPAARGESYAAMREEVYRAVIAILYKLDAEGKLKPDSYGHCLPGFAPIFPDTCYHLTHYWPAAADIPVASDNPV
ncbi:hypothetical protein, partial [Escherichia coli]|uniref:hypothetical protein n=1 Tax=Escherichia coli TaxID=562 RepID=UPI002F96E4ED